jgi:hypothetical protein
MYKQWKSFDDHSFPYLTCNSFSVQCRHIWNYDGYKINPNVNNNWAYIKTDYISDFFNKVNIDVPLVIFTGNSDYTINEYHLQYLNSSKVSLWFAQNANIQHPKLKSIPIGIANAGYSHGEIDIINKIRNENNLKNNLFYCNYSIQNNREEREYCLKQTNIPLVCSVNGGWNGFAGGYSLSDTFEGYLRQISKSYFCISPKGNGIDCHRTWESLYLQCIPIVTKSQVAEEHKDMPIIVLDDWSEFKNIKFDKELYTKIWNNFDVCSLHMDNYLKRLKSKYNI